MDTLQYWYDHGMWMFKFDFVDLSTATPQVEKSQSQEEIRPRNQTAFHDAERFRVKNPDVML